MDSNPNPIPPRRTPGWLWRRCLALMRMEAALAKGFTGDADADEFLRRWWREATNIPRDSIPGRKPLEGKS